MGPLGNTRRAATAQPDRSDDNGLPGPGRLEAFSDGVLAIVVTLLVLELAVPHLADPRSSKEAATALAAMAPKLFGYLLSFLFVAVFWVNHHRFFRLVRRVDDTLLWLNVLLLLALSCIPFPTGMIGEYPRNPVGLAVFSLVLMVGGIAFNLMWRHARACGLFHPWVEGSVVRRATALGLAGPILYATAAGLAFVFPAAAWGVFVLVPLLYAVRLFEPKGKEAGKP